MTDRELLELAAKAAENEWDGQYPFGWNPLTDDADALRLAVKLGIFIPTKWEHEKMDSLGLNVYAATRRAIVRAAAEIGRKK